MFQLESSSVKNNVYDYWMCNEVSSNNIVATKVIYNNPATIVFWNDGTKTIVKTMGKDIFDPERGYLQAYFEKTSGLSKTKCNKELGKLRKQYKDSFELKEKI